MTSVRTFSATKGAFLNAYPRPIHSVYRRVVEELLVELHLDTVNQDFVYDPFFALGTVTIFNALMQSYQPSDQIAVIFSALSKSLQMKQDVLQQDAKTLLDWMQYGDRTQRLKLLQLQADAEDVGGLKAYLERIGSKSYYYSRVLLVGLFTAFETVATPLYPEQEERTQQFIQLTTSVYSFSPEQVTKDLSLYRNAVERMKQARLLTEDLLKATRRQQERRTPPTLSS